MQLENVSIGRKIGLLAITGIGLFVELGRRAHFHKARPELKTAESH
jgi:hypothetical protein